MESLGLFLLVDFPSLFNYKEIPKGAPDFGANLVLSEGARYSVCLSVCVCVDKSRYLCKGTTALY